MSKLKVVHYINQFFANIGGEEKADYKPELRNADCRTWSCIFSGIWRRG